jgi:radical SAM protein with 4Fe4S-binding SPASM domain
VFCPFHGAVKGDNRTPGIMSANLFRTIIDQLAEFPGRIRTLIFCGRGEPTLHKELPEMISYAKRKNVADAIRLTTNGFNLSPELNRSLIDSGLDYIRISVPAIDEQTCYEITGAKLNLRHYIDNIRNLYENKSALMTVFCKTTDVAIGAKNGAVLQPNLAEEFYTAFDNVCDYAFIENIVPQVPRALTDDENRAMWIGGSTKVKNVYSSDNPGSPICERLFYHFTINSQGAVYPCDLNESEALLLGNVNDKNLLQIWNGDALTRLRLSFLRDNIPMACSECAVALYDFPNDLHKYSREICERLT